MTQPTAYNVRFQQVHALPFHHLDDAQAIIEWATAHGVEHHLVTESHDQAVDGHGEPHLHLHTVHGTMCAVLGSVIARRQDGSWFSAPAEMFHEAFEPAPQVFAHAGTAEGSAE